MMGGNIILIGMPGCGKSTVGVLLAKALQYSFVDCDLIIQKRCGMSLQEIIDRKGLDSFLSEEAATLCSIEEERSVIATGGSAVYSDAAMEHLKKGSVVLYISLPCDEIERRLTGSLIAHESGEAVAYGLGAAQERGALFIGPGTPVYAGMVVGICSRNEDMTVNVCKRKQLTNMRASGSDDAIRLITPKILSLEQCLEFLADDELLECTPKSLRIRKRELDHSIRMRELMKRRNQE